MSSCRVKQGYKERKPRNFPQARGGKKTQIIILVTKPPACALGTKSQPRDIFQSLSIWFAQDPQAAHVHLHVVQQNKGSTGRNWVKTTQMNKRYRDISVLVLSVVQDN